MLDGAVFFAIIKEENEVIWMVQDRNPEYFLAIASEKSISKAAERLHISQPYLSQYVIHLEKEFGVRLLDRTKSPLALTAAGKVYANYLEDSSQLYEQLHAPECQPPPDAPRRHEQLARQHAPAEHPARLFAGAPRGPS